MSQWLRALAIPPQWARWLPATSRRFGPPRRIGLIREVVPRLGGRVWTIDDRQPVPQPQPRIHGEPDRDVYADWPTQTMPGTVFELPEACMVSPEATVVTRDDTLLIDTSYWGWETPFQPERHIIYRRKRTAPVRHLAGHCLTLGTDFSVGSFGHMLHDGIARLHLLERAGRSLREFDWIYLPRLESPATRELLAGLLDFPAERILNWRFGEDVSADRVTGTSYPGQVGRIAVEAAGLLRDRAQARWGRGGRRRVYLTRRGYRRTVINEAEISSLLAGHGFVTLDPARDAGVLDACANAEIVLGVDGSNMANLALAPAGAHVVLLMPPEVAPIPYNSTLAVSGGRILHIVVGEPGPEGGIYNADFHLPPARLQAALREVLG